MAQRPNAVSLLLCEKVIIEAGTRNITPVNCFGRRIVKELPSEPMSFVLLTHLTDGNGSVQLEISIERLDTLDEIYQETFTVRFDNPLQEMRCQIQVRRCSFPIAGLYQVKLLASGELIGQKRLLILPKRTS